MNCNNKLIDNNNMDDDDYDYDDDEKLTFGCSAQSAQKRLRSYASTEFERGKQGVLSLLPESYVQQWGKWYLLVDGCVKSSGSSPSQVYVVSPYDVNPGTERTMWMGQFLQLKQLHSKTKDDVKHAMRDMYHLYYDEASKTFGLVSPSYLQPLPALQQQHQQNQQQHQQHLTTLGKKLPPLLPPVTEIHEQVIVVATQEEEACRSLPQIGTRILVCWDGRDRYFAGTILEHQGNVSLIKFDDNDSHWLRLQDVFWMEEESDDELLSDDSDDGSDTEYRLSSAGEENSSENNKKTTKTMIKKRKKKQVDSDTRPPCTPTAASSSSPCRRVKPGILSGTTAASGMTDSSSFSTTSPLTESHSKLPLVETSTVNRVALVSKTPFKRRKTDSASDDPTIDHLLQQGYRMCPHSQRKKLPNGLYAKPSGRIPSGFVWEETCGLWKPADLTTTEITDKVVPETAAEQEVKGQVEITNKTPSESTGTTIVPNEETTVHQQQQLKHAHRNSSNVLAGVPATSSVLMQSTSPTESSDEEVEWDGNLGGDEEDTKPAATATVAVASDTTFREERTSGRPSFEALLSEMEAQKDAILSAIPKSHSHHFSQLGCDTTDGVYSFVEILSPFDDSVEDRNHRVVWYLHFMDLHAKSMLNALPFYVKRFAHKVTFDLLDPHDFIPLKECPPHIITKPFASSNLKYEGFIGVRKIEDDASVRSCDNIKADDPRAPSCDSAVKEDCDSLSVSSQPFRHTTKQEQGEGEAATTTTIALVHDIKSKLDHLLEGPTRATASADSCIALLKRLDSMNVCPDILLETQIGFTIKKLQKRHPSIARVSKPLTKKWMRLLKEVSARKVENTVEMWRDVLDHANEHPRAAERINSFATDLFDTLKQYFAGELPLETVKEFRLDELMLKSSAVVGREENDAFSNLVALVTPYLPQVLR